MSTQTEGENRRVSAAFYGPCDDFLRGQIMKRILEFLRRDDGPTAVEYAVMLAMIVIVCIGALVLLGQNTNSSFTNSGNKITTAMSGS